jgi:hypothetical protein
MAHGGATVAVAVAMSTGLGASAWAATAPVGSVALHVTDYQHVPAGELADAQRLASQVYTQIGVRLVWTGGTAVGAPADGALHVDVLILDAPMTNRRMPAAGVAAEAGHTTKRAYLFYPRIVAQAQQSQTAPQRALAPALAHEIGHMLLPEYSHTASGLMRATSEGRVVNIPPFLPAQATMIRTRLTVN